VDSFRDFVIEIALAALVCVGSLALAASFRATPIATVIGAVLVTILITSGAFLFARRRADEITRRRLLLVVCIAVGMVVALGAVIWLAYCPCT
jgi:hypothetical protein